MRRTEGRRKGGIGYGVTYVKARFVVQELRYPDLESLDTLLE